MRYDRFTFLVRPTMARTNQQVADDALVADRARRAALKAERLDAAAEADAAVLRLIGELI